MKHWWKQFRLCLREFVGPFFCYFNCHEWVEFQRHPSKKRIKVCYHCSAVKDI